MAMRHECRYVETERTLRPYMLFFPQAHSMDFDDTWHPATHPSGAVLPALLAISDMLHTQQQTKWAWLSNRLHVGIESKADWWDSPMRLTTSLRGLRSISLSQLKRAIIVCLCTATACEIVLAVYEVKHMQLGGSEYPDAMWMLSKHLQTAV